MCSAVCLPSALSFIPAMCWMAPCGSWGALGLSVRTAYVVSTHEKHIPTALCQRSATYLRYISSAFHIILVLAFNILNWDKKLFLCTHVTGSCLFLSGQSSDQPPNAETIVEISETEKQVSYWYCWTRCLFRFRLRFYHRIFKYDVC